MMRIGFIGVGGIARAYRGSLAKIEGVEVTAVCDVDAERLAAVAAEEGAEAYDDHATMLAAEELDAVFVCIPPFAHASQVADAARAGLHVFVAKPVALDVNIALATQRAIAKAGVINQSGYMWRSSDAARRAVEIIGDRALGMGIGQCLVNVPGTAWWRVRELSGGQVVEQATHVIDLMRFFLGDVATVHALGHTGLQTDLVDFEDCTVGALRFRSGAVGTLASTNTGGIGRYSVGLAGRDLYLEIDAARNRLTGRVDGETVDYQGDENGYYRQIETFVTAVRTGDQSLIPTHYADAVQSLAVTLAYNESMRRGGVLVQFSGEPA